jgi:hypothetical protein
MGKQFEELSDSGEKVGEPSRALSEKLAAMQAEVEDTSCTAVEEGQDAQENEPSPSKENMSGSPNKNNSQIQSNNNNP